MAFKMENKTLKNFLEKHEACEDGYLFAKDLTLEKFLNSCKRGDWILWLFTKINPESLKELALAKGHCANTVRHLMIDERSKKAVDVAIKFGQGKASREELYEAASAAYAAYAANASAYAANASAFAYADAYAATVAAAADAYAAASATYAANASSAAAAYAANASADAASAFAYASASYASAAASTAAAYAVATVAAREQNQKQTADICREYLPIEIWDQEKII